MFIRFFTFISIYWYYYFNRFRKTMIYLASSWKRFLESQIMSIYIFINFFSHLGFFPISYALLCSANNRISKLIKQDAWFLGPFFFFFCFCFVLIHFCYHCIICYLVDTNWTVKWYIYIDTELLKTRNRQVYCI